MNIKPEIDVKLEELKIDYDIKLEELDPDNEFYQQDYQMSPDKEEKLPSPENIKEETDNMIYLKTEIKELDINFVFDEKQINDIVKYENVSMIGKQANGEHVKEFLTLKNISSLLKNIKEKNFEKRFESDEENFLIRLVMSKFPLVFLNKLTDKELKNLYNVRLPVKKMGRRTGSKSHYSRNDKKYHSSNSSGSFPKQLSQQHIKGSVVSPSLPMDSSDELLNDSSKQCLTPSQVIQLEGKSFNIKLQEDSADFDYSPSTSTEESFGTQIFCTVEKNGNFPSSQSSTDSTVKKITVQNIKDCNFKSRKNYCPYCLKLQTQLPRHMINKHKTEKKVQEFMLYPKTSKERASLLEKLRKLGNFKHNSFVVNNCEGEILPAVRPKAEKKPEAYIPCRNCLGFYPKSILWRHNSQCKAIHKPCLQSKRIVGHGMNLLLNVESCCDEFIEKVVGPMNSDYINLIVRNDLLILKLGESMFLKGTETWKFRYARNAMRELGRFLISLHKFDKSITSLRDSIHPLKFENVVLAAKEVAGFDGISSFKHGSLGLKIGINLKKCAEILSGMYLKEGKEELAIACECFIKQLDQEWANNISSLALRDLNQKKINKMKYLPFIEDFLKLNKYISEEVNNVFNKLNFVSENIESLKGPKSEIQILWMNLIRLTLSSILLLNRRISNEVDRVIISQYEEGLKASSSCPDLQNTPSPSKQMLSNYFMRFEILGKRGNIVHVILSNFHISCINLISKLRNFIGVNPNNKFLFPIPNCGSLNPVSGAKSLRDIVKKANLKIPETMLSTKLRKHVATMSQILNLSQPELEEIFKLIGHDIQVDSFYNCLSDDALRLGKLTKLLIALQNGDILKYRNKTIEEIELNPEELLSDDDEDDEENNFDLLEENEKYNDHENSQTKSEVEGARTSTSGKIVRKAWTKKERRITLEYFKSYIEREKVPGKGDCSKFLARHPQLFHGRNWLHIKYFIHNRIVAINRILID